jgi:hypothetical protein
LLAGGLTLGCRSTSQPPEARFASVTITNRPREQIRETTLRVFGEAGYATAGLVFLDEMVFERRGGTGTKLAYGNWMGGTPVWVRVKAKIVPVTPGVFRLQCNAFVVRDKGDLRIEDETRLANYRGGPYQKLLNEVRLRLESLQ